MTKGEVKMAGYWRVYGQRRRPISIFLDQISLVNKRFIICKNKHYFTGRPEWERQLHLARSSSRSQRGIRLILLAHGAIQQSYVLIFNRESSPEKHGKDNEVVLGIPKEEPKEDSDPIQSDTQLTREVPPSGATNATTSTQADTPEEDTELFSTEYVDKLVASFWTKVDEKIEQAVSHYQSSPQGGQQSNTSGNAHTQEAETEDENKGKKKTLYSFVCLIAQYLNCFLLNFCRS